MCSIALISSIMFHASMVIYSLPGHISHNPIHGKFILPLEMLDRLLSDFTKIIRRLIVIHKSQIHQALLKLDNLMADSDTQVFRRRHHLGQIYII